MFASSTESAGLNTDPDSTGQDSAFFKLLIIGLGVSVSFTKMAIFIGRSPNHTSLLYGDTPLIFFMAFVFALARLLQGGVTGVKTSRIFLPLFLLLLWWGISGMFYAKNDEFFAVSFLQYADGAILVFIAPWVLVRYRLIDFSMDVIMACAMGVAVVAFAQAAIAPSRIFYDICSTLGPNHAQIGLYMLVALAIALHRSYRKAGWWPIAVAGAAFVTILISGSRAAQAGSFAIFAMHFFRKLSFANFLKLAAGAAIVAVVFSYIVKQREVGVQNSAQFEIQKGVKIDISAGRRFLMWMVAWRVINSSTSRFLWGIGFTNFRWEYGKLIKLPFYTNAAHDVFLHIWTETGLLGLLLFLWIFAALIWHAVKYRKKDSASLLLLGLVIAILFTGLTQETLYPNEAFCNVNVLFFFACLLMVLHSQVAAQSDGAEETKTPSLPT